jgi:hypothetical protein
MSLVGHIWSDRHPFSSVGKRIIFFNRARAARFAASATKELYEVAITLAIFLAIMIAFAALDIWIWIPRLTH